MEKYRGDEARPPWYPPWHSPGFVQTEDVWEGEKGKRLKVGKTACFFL